MKFQVDGIHYLFTNASSSVHARPMISVVLDCGPDYNILSGIALRAEVAPLALSFAGGQVMEARFPHDEDVVRGNTGESPLWL